MTPQKDFDRQRWQYLLTPTRIRDENNKTVGGTKEVMQFN